MTLSKKLAKIALEIEAIKIDTGHPFTWASGYCMPVYNDNRRLLGSADHRMLVAQGFQTLIRELKLAADVVAGTATAGIPPATTLADLIRTPLVYVRPSPKKHGMENQIEGILKKGQNAVVIEDVISTGSSALKAVETIRARGGTVEHCFCIFSYGFAEAGDAFARSHCLLHPLLTFTQLLEYAEESATLNKDQSAILRLWYQDPFSWGDRHGFPQKGR